MIEKPGSKIFDITTAKQRRERANCPCEICLMEKHGFSQKKLLEKLQELQKYLRLAKPKKMRLTPIHFINTCWATLWKQLRAT